MRMADVLARMGAKALMAGLFGRPTTVPHTEKAPSAHALRGHIENEIELCIFCGICQKKCPTDAITVVREHKEWAIERFRCIQCGACTESCPKKCLSMHTQRVAASTTLTKDVLHARAEADRTDHPAG